MIFRKATINDLPTIIELLLDDELGKTRETNELEAQSKYIAAFNRINNNPDQYLMVIDKNHQIIGTCQLTLMPGISYQGALRMNIEAVRVAKKYRSQGIGEWMMRQVIVFAIEQGVSMLQLTTNKKRTRAKVFYERLGFEATHEGMKLHLN